MRSLLAFAAALVLAGCQLRPEDPIFVYGLLQDAGGRPLTDRLLLERSVPGAIAQEPEQIEWEPFAEADAAADGSFTLELLYGDTRRLLSDGSILGLGFRLRPASHPSTVIQFWVSDGDVELPPLRIFTQEIALAAEADALRIRRGALPPPVEVPESATAVQPPPDGDGTPQSNPALPAAVAELVSGDATIWRAAMPNEELRISADVLEDFAAPAARVVASARGWFSFEPLVRQFSSLGFELAWSSEALAVEQGARRPASRGAACDALAATACPLTDGAPALVELPDGTFAIEVTLSAPTTLRHAVVRGLRTTLLPTALLLEAREEGGSWTELGDFMASKPHFDPAGVLELFAELGLPPGTRATHVRLRAIDWEAQPIALEAIRELSLFE